MKHIALYRDLLTLGLIDVAFAFAKTPTVGKDESIIPIASYPTSGPTSDQNID